MSKPMTKIFKTQGKGVKFETTGTLAIDEYGVITFENDVEGVVEPHLALSVLDLVGEVVNIKITRKDDEEQLFYEDLV